MSGGGGQTTVSNNSPPPQYLAAYSDVLARAQQNASVPYQQYQGNLLADFSPAQQQAFGLVSSTPGITAPYLNQASQYLTDATNDLTPSYQPQSDQANEAYQRLENSNLPGALTPWQNQASQGFAAGSQALTPAQYSGSAIEGFESPYTQQVVDATQAQFNQQNAQAQTALQGNAASKGALGGDRLGVAQAQLAGQQQLAQAPVIANLRNQGFNQAQQEFNTQQQVGLNSQLQSEQLQQQAAQGYAGLGSQALTAAQQQAALQGQAGQGFAGLGQLGLSGAQSQGWLNSQAGQGFAGLGNEALGNTLQEASALEGIGGQQQTQAQQELNIPYQQFLAQQAYPYQQTGWLSNIALGLGSGSGTSSSQTTPGPSAASSIGGLGAAAAGVGLAGYNNGWFSGGGSAYPAAGTQAALDAGIGAGGYSDTALANTVATAAAEASGGRVRGFAGGGEVPDLTITGVPQTGNVPGGGDVTSGFGAIPNAGASVIPSGPQVKVTPLINRDYGTTTHTSGSGDSTLGSILKLAGTVAATAYGGPAGGAAASALGSQVHFNRGGFAPRAGGHVPVLPRGFAAGGAPAISVQSIPNAAGKNVPTMVVDPSASSSTAQGVSGSSADLLNAYLQQTAASAKPPPVTPPPAAAVTPPAATDGGFAAAQQAQQQAQQAQDDSLLISNNGAGGMMRRGGLARGFDAGGDVDDPDAVWPSGDLGHVTNRPVGAALGDWIHGRHPALGPDATLAPETPDSRKSGFTVPVMTAPSNMRPVDISGDGTQDATSAGTDTSQVMRPRVHPLRLDLGIEHVDAGDLDPVTGQPRMAPSAAPADTTSPGELPYAGGFAARRAPSGAADAPILSTPDGPGDPQPRPLPVRPIPPDASPNSVSASPASAAAMGPPDPSGSAGPKDVSSPRLDPGSASPSTGGFSTPVSYDPSTGGFGRRINDSSDELRTSRALQEDRASLPIALMTAGFGMMASKSPHPLQAMGEGALAGVQQYVSADRAAKELAAKVDENRVRLKETQAYREATAGINQQKADAQTSRANTAAAAQIAQAAAKAAQQANPRLTAAQLRDNVMTQLQQTINPATGQNYTAGEAFAFTGGLDTRQQRATEAARHNKATEGLSGDRNQIALARLQNTTDYQQARLMLDQTKLDEQTKNAILATASRNVTADLSGKKTIQGEVNTLTQARGGIAPPSAAAKAPAPASGTGAFPTPPASVPAGSQYNPARRMWRDSTGKLYDANGTAVAAGA